ncbi:MAG TPA: ribosome biogenesis GTP-binding protein YihA/YsxC [Micropepsaceae bacterium]|jgi:GTP-binding protein|nr:ribosome biogenesis GTP-binding protein YihA/YsxC [Micropepsaceae bacterium]
MTDSDADEAQKEAEEKGRILFAQECEFLRGAANLDGIPPPDLPEVAFVGRSNVGKSSLINTLTGRKTLARVSNTPGRTREINFFRLGGRLLLADLPGYGYARVSRSDSERWTELIFAYLRGRPNLRRAVLLIDSRRGGPLPQDVEVMTLLDRSAVSYQMVLTKTDKLRPGELANVEAQANAEARRHGAAHPELIATSAVTGDGIARLRAALTALAAP